MLTTVQLMNYEGFSYSRYGHIFDISMRFLDLGGTPLTGILSHFYNGVAIPTFWC